MITLPEHVIKNIQTYFGRAGLAWADNFDAHIKQTCKEWGLTLMQPFSNLSINYVTPVTLNDGYEAVLKIGFPNADLITECHALIHFGGNGAVRVLRSVPEEGKILLEYIKPGTPLTEVQDDEEATRLAAQVMGRLFRPPLNESMFPTVNDWLDGFQELRNRFSGQTGPFESELFFLAEQLSSELLASSGEQVLLHGDLHHANIVFSDTQGWGAIDPKGVIGEREYEAGAFLRNPMPDVFNDLNAVKNFMRRVDIFCETLGFDKQRVIAWAVVQGVLSSIWGVEGPKEHWQPCFNWTQEISSLL